MSDAPLFQNTDEQEAIYGSSQDAAGTRDIGGFVAPIPLTGISSGGTASALPTQGAGTSGVFPPAGLAAIPAADDDDQVWRGSLGRPEQSTRVRPVCSVPEAPRSHTPASRAASVSETGAALTGTTITSASVVSPG